MSRIAVIGGGLTGVSVAYELTRRGHTDFVLYESSSRLGGIVETHRQDGFVIECGADSWVTEKPWARELAIELGLEDEIIPSNDAHRRTYLLQGSKLIPMPDGMRMMVPTDL
jgi:oxygen-dependent protoporphyrinogen oxidase